MICLNILDFILFDEIEKVHTCFMPTEITEREFVLTGDFQLHFLELPKVEFTGQPELQSRIEK